MKSNGVSPGSKAIVALSVLMLVAPASAAVAQSLPVSPLTAQSPEQKTFNIPPQPLQAGLIQFGQQAGRQIAVDGAAIRGLSTPGVQGTMTIEQALQRLLTGSGLTFTFPSSTTIAVQRPGQEAAAGAVQLDPLQVQGTFPVPSQAMIDNLPPPYAGGQVATGGQLGLLGNRPVMDTPFNQTNFTAKKAQDQQAKTVRDVLIDDPSVRSSLPDASGGSDQFRVRGFPAGGDGGIAYGGLFGMAPAFSVMAEMAERVEILKGPSVLLNGMLPSGSVGGLVNIIPKRAPEDDLTQVTGSYVSSSQFGVHADVGRRWGADKQVGARFNGVFKAGQTEIEGNTDQRGLAILGLDFRGDHIRVAVDAGYQYQYIGGQVSYLGLANGVGLPWAPNARINQGQPWNYNQRKDMFGVIRGEVDLTERVTAYAAFGMHDWRSDSLYTLQNVVSNINGAATANAPNTLNNYRTYLTAEAGVRGTVETGPIGHEFGLTATTYESVNGFGSVIGTAFATNIYNPVVIARPNLGFVDASKMSSSGRSSLAIADTLTAADKRIQLTAGMRLQNVVAQNFNAAGQATTGYDQSALSPAVALIFKPWQNVSFYGNFIQGLQQGTVVSTPFANAGEIFPPYKTTQYEAGVKVDWGKLTTTASLFQILQPSILTNVATNTQYLGGEQRNQGLEVNVFGEPMAGVRLLGGVMFLNAVLAKTQGGTTDGWIAPFSPGFSLNLAGEWDLPFVRGLTVDGRAIYTGSQYVDTTWPRRSLPEWTRFDIGARYTFENPGAKGKLLVARFNIDNLFDTTYWEGGNGVTTMFLGMPRTYRVSLTANF